MTKLVSYAVIALIACCINPSLKFSMNSKQINLLQDKIADLIFGNFNTLSIPNIDYDFVHLSDIKLQLQGFTGDHLEIKFVEASNNITLSAHNAGFLIQAKAIIDVGNFSTDLNITANKMGCVFNLSLGADKNLRPDANITGMKMVINPDDLQVVFSGNPASWIVTLIVTVVKTIFADKIIAKLESTIPVAINTVVDTLLDKIPTSLNIGPMKLLAGLTQNPSISSSYLVFPMITSIQGESSIPFEPALFPDHEPGKEKGLEILLNDYIYNNLLYLLCQQGSLHLNFSSKLFGYNFTFECGLDKCPSIKFEQNGIDTSIDGYIAFKIIGIKIDIKVKADLSIHPVIINQQIGLLIEKIKISNLKIMGFEAMWLSNLLNPVFENLKGLMNQYLDDILIPIPSISGIDYSDIELSIYSGYMSLGVTPIFNLVKLLMSP